MKFKLEFNMDTAAFQDGMLVIEVKRISKIASDYVMRGEEKRTILDVTILDVNGNHIGRRENHYLY